jgi:hypothetical protein
MSLQSGLQLWCSLSYSLFYDRINGRDNRGRAKSFSAITHSSRPAPLLQLILRMECIIWCVYKRNRSLRMLGERGIGVCGCWERLGVGCEYSKEKVAQYIAIWWPLKCTMIAYICQQRRNNREALPPVPNMCSILDDIPCQASLPASGPLWFLQSHLSLQLHWYSPPIPR